MIEALSHGLDTVAHLLGQILGSMFAALGFVCERLAQALCAVLEGCLTFVGKVFCAIGPAVHAFLEPLVRFAGIERSAPIALSETDEQQVCWAPIHHVEEERWPRMRRF